MFFFVILCVCFFIPSDPHTNLQAHTQTCKPDQTKININGFDMAKSAAKLLYSPVLVTERKQTLNNINILDSGLKIIFYNLQGNSECLIFWHEYMFVCQSCTKFICYPQNIHNALDCQQTSTETGWRWCMQCVVCSCCIVWLLGHTNQRLDANLEKFQHAQSHDWQMPSQFTPSD